MADAAPRGEERRFSRAETALILRRATEDERRLDAGRSTSEDSLTLDEIVAAATAAGIDPAAVRRAASVSVVAPGPRVLGAPTEATVEATFAGRFPPDRQRAARAAIERTLGRPGEVEAVASTWVWREEHGLGRTAIETSGADGRVTVVAHAEAKGDQLALIAASALVVGAVLVPLGGFAGLAALGGPFLAAFAPPAAIFALARTLWPMRQRKTIRGLEAAVVELGAVIEEGPGRLPAGEEEAR